MYGQTDMHAMYSLPTPFANYIRVFTCCCFFFCVCVKKITVFVYPISASVFSNIGYLNVTIGIRDPSVFVVPKICNEGSEVHMEVLFFHKLLPKFTSATN